MSYNCFIDHLPIELLHKLFNYFLAHETFFTFSNITNYVNAALESYSKFRLNFQSIQKSNFDLVCHRIRPDKVIFLTLSDDNDTPDQSPLFLSHFYIEQFTQLKSLVLIQPNVNSLKTIYSHLHLLNHFHSLSMDTEFINQIQIDQFINLHLLYLKLTKCSHSTFEILIQHQLQLKSFEICLHINKSTNSITFKNSR